jgi:hypothetical protein
MAATSVTITARAAKTLLVGGLPDGVAGVVLPLLPAGVAGAVHKFATGTLQLVVEHEKLLM